MVGIFHAGEPPCFDHPAFGGELFAFASILKHFPRTVNKIRYGFGAGN
jgi:hypothetical protein